MNRPVGLIPAGAAGSSRGCPAEAAGKDPPTRESGMGEIKPDATPGADDGKRRTGGGTTPRFTRGEIVERRRALRRKQIFEGASRVFAEKGFHAATVREVAKASGIAKGTVYEYVRNKQDMLILVIEEGLAMMKEAITLAVEKERDPVRKLEILIRTQMEFLDRYREESRVVHREIKAPGMGENERAKLERLKADYLNMVGGILSEGVRERGFRRLDPYLHAALLGHLCVFWADYGDSPGETATLKEVSDAIVRVYLEGVLAGRPGARAGGREKSARGGGSPAGKETRREKSERR
ncbi:MAG: TetR/AcrR family transcriptional regulator [bacterium]